MSIEVPGVRSLDEFTTRSAPRDTEEELGRTAFLELMIAQIQNQDPLEPAKNEDFIAQLAQFSSVEGIQNLNESMDALVGSLRANMAIDAAGLVGRNVLIPTDTTLLNTNGGIAGAIDVPDAVGNLVVEIANSSGQTVQRFDYGARPAGSFRFEWDGTTATGEPVAQDRYRISAYAEIDGVQQNFAVSLPDQVLSVTIDGGNMIANLAGGGAVPAAQIKEIQ